MMLTARHLARHWLAYLLASLAVGMLVLDLSGHGPVATSSRVFAYGLAPLLVPGLMVCMVLWAVGMRLDSARRELESLRTELERAQSLGRTGNWSYADGRFEWSARSLQMLGVPAGQATTLEQFSALLAAEDRPQFERAWLAAQAGASHRAEFSVTGADGERRLLFEGRMEDSEDAAGWRLAGIVQDITDRYFMERELRRAMSYQRALMDNFPFMVWLKDRDLRFLAVNKPLALAGGLEDPEQARGLEDHDLWPADQADSYRADDLEVLRSRAPRCTESLVAHGDSTNCFEIWKAPVFDDEGVLLGSVGFARDISDRKRDEAALKQSRDQLAELGRLQVRFIQGEGGEALFSSMLHILFDLSGCSDGFVAEIFHDSRSELSVNLLACCGTDWLNDRADLIDVALLADGLDYASGSIIAAAPTDGDAKGLCCVAVMDARRLVGLIGLATPDGVIDEDRLASVQAAVGTFGLILQAGMREHERRRSETELKRHRDRLTALVEEQLSDSIAARQMAEEANRAKSRFMASMSHELRTPIHAILGFSRLALRDRPPLADTTRQRIEVILKNGDRLLALVDDLLDLSRLEAGAITLNVLPCNLEELMRDAAEAMQAAATERHIRIDVSGVPPELSISVDAHRLSQVLCQLLDNAIRFSPPGDVVQASFSRHWHVDRDGVLLSVCDNGPGIPENERDAVFDQFDQASRLRGEAGGTGLGLAICREIVMLHGGWIRAANRPEGGTCVELWLSVNAAETPVNPVPAVFSPPDLPTRMLPRTETVR
jgi:PAS domain S-box-containing protein